ncbi:MAG: adenylate/guanylate cyclase domain-containing protein [Gammaproteobacteria bacterium]|nr:MAG: adenylate/guanylate cyclase domain-containing protein [Gammaproteobacteria bacterium]
MKSTLVKKQTQLVDSIMQEFRQAEQLGEPELESRLTQLITDFYEDSQPSQAREVTILLSDIRGFSAMSERYETSQIVSMLNHYFSKMNEIILKYDGVIDKYMGDAIMALFGVPEQSPDDAHRAITCAVEMQNAMDEVNSENKAQGLPELFMGIGINSDIVSAGQVGSHLHNEYTVIGDGVNLASRIESHSLRGQILISDYTYQKVKDVVQVGDINEVRVKGKSEKVQLYEITATNWQDTMTVPRREIRNSLRVNFDTDFPFQVIENEEVQPGIYFGYAKDISYSGIFAFIKQPLDVLTEIKLSLSLSLLGGETRDIYGKIKSIRETDGGYGCGMYRIHFTG